MKHIIKSLLRKLGYEIRPLNLNGAMDSIHYNSPEQTDAFYNDQHLLDQYITINVADHISNLKSLLKGKEINPEGKKVIDVGCGTGHCLNYLKTNYNNIQLKGTEFANAALRIATKIASGVPIVNLNIEIEALSEQFDIVLCQQVLEHIADYETALQNLWNMTKPGGYLILTVPDGRIDSFAGHIHFWSKEGFSILLEKHLHPKEADIGHLQDSVSLYAMLLK